MKKVLLSLAFAVAACISVTAQNTTVNSTDNKAHFGIRFGGEIILPGKITSDNVGISVFDNGGGVEFGGIYNVPVAKNFYIEPGLKLYCNNYSLKKEFVEALEDDIIFNSVSLKKYGMRVPVMAGCHFDFTSDTRVSFFTGPELEVGFSAKEYIKGYNIEMSDSVYGDEGGFNRTNLLWGIGAGISYQHFYFGVSGGIGISNMLSDSDVKFHENRISFSVGYNF